MQWLRKWIFSHQVVLKLVDEIEVGLEINPKSIKEICQHYNLDSEKIVAEMDSFSSLYKSANSSVDLCDVLFQSQAQVNAKKKEDEKIHQEEAEEEENTSTSDNQWIE